MIFHKSINMFETKLNISQETRDQTIEERDLLNMVQRLTSQRLI